MPVKCAVTGTRQRRLLEGDFRFLWETTFSGTCKQRIVEWRFAHLAKPKEIADKKEPVETVLGGEASPAGANPSTKSVKKGKLPPKNKSRLPRRQKKAQQKAASRG